MNVHELVLVVVVVVRLSLLVPVFMVILTCAFVEETFSLLSPPPLPHGGAHPAGRGKVQDASGSESSELRDTDGHISSTSSSFILSVGGVVADQLVNGVC